MVKDKLKISVVMPVYNSIRFFERALTSILSQDYPHVECIVIDGGSTDGTIDIINKYSANISYWTSEKDSGQSHALNKGFQIATGDVYCWLNSDEAYLPGTLRKVAATFEAYPKADIIWGNRIVIDDSGNEIGRVRYPDISPFRFIMYGMRVLPTDATWWKRDIHYKTGCIDQVHFGRTGMDFDWFLRMSLHVSSWKHIDEYLSLFTERPDRVTSVVGEAQTKKDAKYARKRIIEHLNMSPVRLYCGWMSTNLYMRWFEGRVFKMPHLIKSFKNIQP